MKLGELRTGMVVTLRNGGKYMVFRKIHSDWTNDDVLVQLNGDDYLFLAEYDSDMMCKGAYHDPFDIMEVWVARQPLNFVSFNKEEYYTLLWKREEPKEMTMAEIEAALGYKIRIVERK